MKKNLFFLIAVLPTLGFPQINTGLVYQLPLDGNMEVTGNGSATMRDNTFKTDVDRKGNFCSGDFTNTSFNGTLQSNVNNGRSLSFWVKRNENVGDYIFETGAFPLISRSNDSLKIDLFNYDRTGFTFLLEKNEWVHVTWVYSKKEVHYIYINGEQKVIYTNPVILFPENGFLAGSAGCSLDDIRVYEKELFARDVKDLYNLPSSCTLTSIDNIINEKSDKAEFLFATDIIGRFIEDTKNYSGILIFHYRNGKSEKVVKNNIFDN